MSLKLRQVVTAALALVATLFGFYVVLVAWALTFVRCPDRYPPDALLYVPLALVIIAGVLGSAFLISRRPGPMWGAAAWGMLVGWILWAVLAISVRGPLAVCGMH